MNYAEQNRRIMAAVAALILLGLCAASRLAAQMPTRSDPKTFTLGLVSEINQKEIERHFQPLVRYVAGKLSPGSKIEGRVVVAATPSRLASLLTQRNADFYMESAQPTYMINDVYGAGKLLLRRWKGGMGDYKALIFAAKNGAARSMEDIKGKLIAFEDPGSTSGYFLPKLFLEKKGFKLQESRIGGNVRADEIGYVFARSQDKLIELVLTGKVAAGAFSSDDFAGLDAGKKAAVAILAETASLPRHLVSVRKDLSSGRVRSLEKTLLSMHENPEGRTILQKADGTTKFDPLPGGEVAMRQRLLETFYSPEKK